MRPFLFLLMVLVGCKVGPNYHPSDQEVPDEWIVPEETKEAPLSDEPPPVLWWEVFKDPLLNRYIEIAARYNYNVLQAEANIFQTRALRQVTAAPLYPHVSADWDAFHVFLSKNGLLDLFPSAQQTATTTTTIPPIMPPKMPQQFNMFNNFLDAIWEIDIFGKTQRSVEAAQAQLESTIEQKNDLLVSVFAEIARNYIELRSSQKQKMLLEDNVNLLQQNVQLIQKRHTSGYSNLLDLEQIEIQLNQALSTLPAVNTAIYRSIFALSVLIGERPETLLEELLPFQWLPVLPECLSVGLRSDLLRRRPDVREAERNLAQATANIGVAVASFYPSFSLIGILGLSSIRLSNLYTPNSKTWVYGGDINMPIFQGGKLIGNLKIAEAQAAAAAFAYQQAILNALQDAETTLVSYEEDVKAMKEFEKIVVGNKKLTTLNYLRYTKGLVGRLDYLNSQLILNNAELSLLQSETSALLDLISLYKALGGGWEPFSPCCCSNSVCNSDL